ncbi:MAG: acyl-CoA thioesterase [Myxococcales bacterium]|nr:acyl-CoA thioesterase [Myxococcales bacterium]
MARTPRMSRPPAAELRHALRQRVIYADTDQMGFVYHGTYPRFLEAARVEFMRALGHTYAETEAAGFGMPLTDLAISYIAPARYDDLLSVQVGVAEMSFARLRLGYHVTVEPGDRVGLQAPLTVVFAETCHCCIRLADGRPTRFPDELRATLLALANPEPE